MKHRFLYSILLILAIDLHACSTKAPDVTPTQPPTQPETQSLSTSLYETWSPLNIHYKNQGLGFDVASAEGAKYLELGGNWLKPEHITAELAKQDDIPCACERAVRWLAASSATFHFPMDPDEFDGDLTLHVQLRPKVNESVSVKFYKTDSGSENAWTTPKTLKLAPGWKDNAITIPHDWLNKHGNQLMRLSFQGTYFEGDDRVAAKFVRIELDQAADTDLAPSTISTPKHALKQAPCRIDDTEKEALILQDHDALERYTVLPDDGLIHISAAPAPWLMSDALLSLTARTDSGEKTMLLEQTIHPGDVWSEWTAPIPDDLAGTPVKLVLSVKTNQEEDIFPQLSTPSDSVCLLPPQVLVPEQRERKKAFETIAQNTDRIVLIGLDNLRADRLLSDKFAETAPNLHKLKKHGFYGSALGESLGNIATTTSFLTGLSLAQHAVHDDATHLKQSFTTIAEALPEWKSHFYTTSNAIEPSRGFAQGFHTTRRLNKENLGSAKNALQTLADEVSRSPKKSLFYLHLSSLRLPLTPSDENFKRFALPGYTGPVNAKAMQNVAVLKDPTPADSKQFSAYYDASLADVDEAIKPLLDALPPKTLVLLYGTHGCSLGESTLGYMQTLAPWEVVVPWVMFNNAVDTENKLTELISVYELHSTLLSLFSAAPQVKTSAPSLATPHSHTPVSYGNALTASATNHLFYRIRREGVDVLFQWGDPSQPLQTKELDAHPISKRALRELIPQ